MCLLSCGDHEGQVVFRVLSIFESSFMILYHLTSGTINIHYLWGFHLLMRVLYSTVLFPTCRAGTPHSVVPRTSPDMGIWFSTNLIAAN